MRKGTIIRAGMYPETLVEVFRTKNRTIQICQVKGVKGNLYITKYWTEGDFEPHEICPDLYSLPKSILRAKERLF